MRDYINRLKRDLVEQFKGKPNIETLQKALARQLDDLYTFFEGLNTLRWLKEAQGVQLDGIGDIVVMSRTEALALSKLANKDVPMDDETYRLYLAWKIALNTTNCTHTDVYNALRLFWDKSPLYYSEELEHPATIFFTTPLLSPEDNAAVLLTAPKIKAAGVALKVIAKTQTPDLGGMIVRVAAVGLPCITQITLPQDIPEPEFNQNVNVAITGANITEITMQEG